MDNLIHADCLDAMAAMEAESIDAIVTDPPYDLTSGKKGGSGVASVNLDSPYGRARIGTGNGSGGFMGKAWDGTGIAFRVELWAEAFRIAKPGAHLLAFGGTRTVHRMTAAIEDAGWEIRDMLVWGYASGFPKSLDVSKAIDKRRAEDRAPVDTVRSWLNARRLEAGYSHDAVNKHFGHASNGGGSSSAWMTNPTSKSLPTWEQWQALKALLGFGDEMDAEVWRLNGRKGTPGEAWGQREKIGEKDSGLDAGSGTTVSFSGATGRNGSGLIDVTAPATPDAEKWNGWGTALKPAWEPIVMARKPLSGTVAATVLSHGTGALNIDGTRIAAMTEEEVARSGKSTTGMFGLKPIDWKRDGREPLGRWPANVILTDPIFDGGVDGVVGGGETTTGSIRPYEHHNTSSIYGGGDGWRTASGQITSSHNGDSGTYSRFFLIPKSARAEREPVLGGLSGVDIQSAGSLSGRADGSLGGPIPQRRNVHPTVKPLDLMRHLVRLVTPPGGTVLDPFLGSGTTALAAEMEGFAWIGIEKEAEYVAIAEARLNGVQKGLGLVG